MRSIRIVKLSEIAFEYIENYFYLFLKKINHGGARKVSVDEFGNTKVSLLRNTFLGERHQEIVVSADSVLLYNVQRFGVYEKSLIRLFRRYIKEGPFGATFVDIGANCGLISLGVANNNPKISRVIAIEPIPQNIVALEKNFRIANFKYSILNYGLSTDTTKNEIFVPTNQFGSATLNPHEGSGQRIRVDLATPSQLYRDELSDKKNLYIKCDIEGKDIEVLANFPSEVWKNVNAVSFEISRIQLDRISEIIDLLIDLKSAGLEYFYLESRFPRIISIEEIRLLTLNPTRNNWNIFVCRA